MKSIVFPLIVGLFLIAVATAFNTRTLHRSRAIISVKVNGNEPKLQRQVAAAMVSLTLDQHLDEFHASDSSAARDIISVMAKSAIEIQHILATATITGASITTGDSSGNINSSGDEQKSLDILCNDIVKNNLLKLTAVKGLVSEEEDGIIVNASSKEGKYIVTYDPLDGSSNVECATPTGTIFGVYLCMQSSLNSYDMSHFHGKNLVAAGYVMYSSSIEMVVTLGEGTHGYTLNPTDKKWYLTRKNIKIPERGPYYSLNEGRSFDWPKGLTQYINDIKGGKGQSKKKYSIRYVCSLVADLHRTLLYGGWAGNPRNHLRLLYEAAPLAYIVKEAGGLGSDGVKALLDIAPQHIHHRLPVFLGSKLDIRELESYDNVQQL